MINGIMKLFYKEIIKTKISKLPNEQYQINNQLKKIQQFSNKIDKLLLVVLKTLIMISMVLISSKLNIYLAFSVFLFEMIYLFYKKSLKYKIKTNMSNFKINIKASQDSLLQETDKKNISFLISILILGLITKFNIIIFLCICLIFTITIKNIYINYKKNK